MTRTRLARNVLALGLAASFAAGGIGSALASPGYDETGVPHFGMPGNGKPCFTCGAAKPLAIDDSIVEGGAVIYLGAGSREDILSSMCPTCR